MSCSLKKGTFKEQRSVFSKFLTRTFREIFDKASLENENSIFVEEIPRAGFLIGIPVSIKGNLPVLVECLPGTMTPVGFKLPLINQNPIHPIKFSTALTQSLYEST